MKKKIFFFFILLLFPLFSKKSRIKKNKKIKSASTKIDYSKYKYVIFDVCNCFWKNTIYDLLYAYQKQVKIPFSGYLDLMFCGTSYIMGKLDAKKGYETFFKYSKSMTLNEIENKCHLIWSNCCKNNIFQKSSDLFYEYKKKGYITIMVDTGIEQLYSDLLKNYKFDYAITSSLEFKDRKTTGKLVERPCSGLDKLKKIKNLIEDQLGGNLKQVVFYANSYNDIPLLKEVGKAFVVNPYTNLKRAARLNKWNILNFKKVVKKDKK